MAHPTAQSDWFPSGPSGLKVVIFQEKAAVTEAALTELRHTLQRCAQPKVGLATGGTFTDFYARIVQDVEAQRLDVGRLHLTHLDEFVGFTPESPGGMVTELSASLLGAIGDRLAAFHPVPTPGLDGPEAASAHAAMLRGLGPLDLQFLGIGHNGHLAFNEPGTPFHLGSHVAALTEDTLNANHHRFPSDRPSHAVTTGPADLLRTKRLVLCATGAGKAPAVRRALEEAIDPACPASLLRLHQDAIIFLDGAAASELTEVARRCPQALPMEVLDHASLRPDGPVVVISPHPDDASISCGGLLASLPSETHRHILTMTTGARAVVPGVDDKEAVAALREEEVRREAAHLNAETSFLRGAFYEEGAFNTDDVRRLTDELVAQKPAWILAPDLKDGHPTHRLARQVLDAAVEELVRQTGKTVQVWSFEGPWFQHPRADINGLVRFDAAAEAKKIAAVCEHKSQLARVPFDAGASALSRLRGIGFSETHFGGTEPGKLQETPLVEAYVRVAIG